MALRRRTNVHYCKLRLAAVAAPARQGRRQHYQGLTPL